MATGRHEGYPDNEFTESEANLSSRELVFSKKNYDRIKSSKKDFERGQLRGDVKDWNKDMGDRVRIRRRVSREREMVNDAYQSATSMSDSGGGGIVECPRKRALLAAAVDREPGELSSESGSDESIDSESNDQDSEVKKDSMNQSPVVSKKRKFSPIVWDRDDKVKVVNDSSKSRIAAGIVLPPLPPLPLPSKSGLLSPNININGELKVSPIKDNKPHSVERLTTENSVSFESHVRAYSISLVHPSFSMRKGEHWGQNQTGTLEEDDYLPTRTIKASRWANDADSPPDEGEISVDEEMYETKGKKLNFNPVQMHVHKLSVSPELGEAKGAGSDGTRGRSSESDERLRSSSREDYPNNNLDENESMEINENMYNNATSVSHSDTDSEDEHDSRGAPDCALPPQRSLNMLQGCRSVDEFERLNKIDEGTYGVVYRARDKKTQEIVALKKVKMEKEREGFPMTSLREINILLSFHHPSIVDVKEVVVGSNLNSIFMVMEYMEHDLKALMETMKQPFSQSEVKCLMLQLLEGVKYLHDNWVLHRDLKTSNLLLNNQGNLKICDFGLARQYGSPLKPYTHLVVTLWYRAPELLLGAREYSTEIDMWSLGCIMAELLSKEPLFNGKTEFEQLDKIFRTLGTPNETIWPGFSKLPGVKVNFVKHRYNMLRKKFPATSFTGSHVLSDTGFDLLNKLLTYDPKKRITAEAALDHDWFREVPLPKAKEFMPTFPAHHSQDRRTRRILKSPDPLEEQRLRELQQGELGTAFLAGVLHDLGEEKNRFASDAGEIYEKMTLFFGLGDIRCMHGTSNISRYWYLFMCSHKDRSSLSEQFEIGMDMLSSEGMVAMV